MNPRMLKQELIRPPKLRTSATEEKERHATWLELFYDLVLVVAVSQVAHVLSLDHSFRGILVAIGLFMPVGWVWAGHTVYATRFDTDDLVYRLFTFLQMFAVMGMAVEVAHAAHGAGRGFGISYLGARVILLILLARAFYHVREARPFNRVYLIGFGIGAGIWALSLLLPQDRQWVLWMLSLMVELPVPWYIWFKRQPLSDLSASHIPERFGLFTIIVLGESVVAPARGLTGQRWQPESVATAAFGFLVAICVWWIYFRHMERAIGRFTLGSGQPYIYSHIPFWVGIIMMSVGTDHAITESASLLSSGTVTLLLAGFGLWGLGGFMMDYVTDPEESHLSRSRYLVTGGMLFFLATANKLLTPVVMLGLMAACSLLSVFFDERTHLKMSISKGRRRRIKGSGQSKV